MLAWKVFTAVEKNYLQWSLDGQESNAYPTDLGWHWLKSLRILHPSMCHGFVSAGDALGREHPAPVQVPMPRC